MRKSMKHGLVAHLSHAFSDVPNCLPSEVEVSNDNIMNGEKKHDREQDYNWLSVD